MSSRKRSYSEIKNNLSQTNTSKRPKINSQNESNDDYHIANLNIPSKHHATRSKKLILPKMEYSQSQIHKAISNSSLVTMLFIPAAIINALIQFCWEEFILSIDRSMVTFTSCNSYPGYPIDHLFTTEHVYCTEMGASCVEMVIKLSTKNHDQSSCEYEIHGDNNGFCITDIGVCAPKYMYTAPVERMIVWSYVNEPTVEEMKQYYGTLNNVKGKMNEKKKDNGRCIAFVDDIHETYYGTKNIRVLNSGKVKYIVVKFMSNKSNVDIKQFWLKVKRY
eukprot:125754_1